jgi:ATP-dependent helicase Lhr and Lhr-like helicase
MSEAGLMRQIKAIRRQLPHAWVPFFTRFGGRLTPVQIDAIPNILAGQNVVIASATASGKTEAVVAPTAQRWRDEHWAGTSIVYITPTRALANDLFARLEMPLAEMNLSLVLKHGEKQYIPKGEVHMLITTPESLDSLLCRQPERLVALRTLILDEIHLLDQNYRGDQLRVLLNRLAGHSKTDFSTHLVSATLADPHAVAARYTRDAVLVTGSGKREMNAQFADDLHDVATLARNQEWHKLLIFANKRATVEQIASTFAPLWKPYPVLPHHGKLAKAARERAETAMKECSTAVIVATSTLEIGIDIGDIDAVVLADPPWSLSAMYQRIGRGNRRSQQINVIAIAEDANVQLLYEAMFDAVRQGELPMEEDRSSDRSVVVQQVFSMLYQHRGGLESSVIAETVSPLATKFETQRILAHMVNEGHLIEERRLWRLSRAALDEAEKGTVHSNIPGGYNVKVIEVSSGREVGQIGGTFDSVFMLAGRFWRIVNYSPYKVWVEPTGRPAGPAEFTPSNQLGKYWSYLPAELRKKEA